MLNNKQQILLVGGGGHCKSVIDVIEQEGKFTIAGIIDKKELIGQEVLGYKIIGSDDDLGNLSKQYKFGLITVGQIKSNVVRIKLFQKLKDIGYNLPIIISPQAYVSKHATIDEGTIIMHGVIVNANARISSNCIINTKALIEHDVLVGEHCHISTSTVLNGGTVVEAHSFVGSNATTKEYSNIGGFIKAGSVEK